MTLNGWVQIAIFFVILTLLTRPVGGFMTRIFTGERTWLTVALGPVERFAYRLGGIDPQKEQHWLSYAFAMLALNAAGFVFLYVLQRVQGMLPLNPAGQVAVPPTIALNTAISFVSNTNWQAYSGETTMSLLTQMTGLTVQNFLSAATGIALSVALIRGFARKSSNTIGNFWVDVTRTTLYVLLPVSFVLALVFVWQGMPQTFSGSVTATTLEGAQQVISQGPVASQEVIKMLGTNGGGFFNGNSAHPYENPTAMSNLLQMLMIFILGAGLTNVFGRMVGNERQGWAIYGTMLILAVAGVAILYWAEAAGNPAFTAYHVDQLSGAFQVGGNMEGKEVRFGIANTALFATVTTDASCGAVNAMHDSLMPLGGLMPIVNMVFGEVIFGGVGSGFYGILLFIIIAMFVAGLMVGRTPEYAGKKLESREVKMTILAILIMPLFLLGLLAGATVLDLALSGLANAGPHGFSEMFYAYASGVGNNGSAFAGLTATNGWWTSTMVLAMWFGRYGVIIPMLAIAGSLAAKKKVPASLGTFPTTGVLFISLLMGTIIIIGGLTYFPAAALGPIVEHIAMQAGNLF